MAEQVKQQRTTRERNFEFVNLQLRLSGSDSADTAVDSEGVLHPGRFISANSLVREVNRLLKAGYRLLFISPVGQEKIGANLTGVTVKVVMAKGTGLKPQSRFSFLLFAERPSNIDDWENEMAKRYKAGFRIFGDPKSVAFDRTGVNMWYAFVK